MQTARVGEHGDGAGLLLRVDTDNARWVLRYSAPDGSGRRREMGLGACERHSLQAAGRSLALARERATAARELLKRGVDPIDQRADERAAAVAAAAERKSLQQRATLTLARAARDYHARAVEPVCTAKHAAQWIASLEQHVPAALWHAPIATIEAPALLDAVAELALKVPETAHRVRQRLEAVFDDAEFRKLCAGNPARALRRKLGKAGRGRKGQFAALPFAEVPAFMQRLREQPGIAARALGFAILTAARTGEVLGATWREFDADAALWTVPAARMKAGEAHVVHLSDRALAILRDQRALGAEHVFPSPLNLAQPLSNMSMLALLRRLGVADKTTVHGFRAAFSTWAYETAAARPDVIEACLAHSEADRVKAAYNRAQFATERAALLKRWGDFCGGAAAPADNVVELPTRGAA